VAELVTDERDGHALGGQFGGEGVPGSSGAGQPAARNSPIAASSSSRPAAATIWCTREDESLTAAASARMDTPSARADASAQLRSRSACSSRHAARDTSSTRRFRRHVTVCSAIFTRTACPACTVQQSGHAGGVHGVVLTNTPSRVSSPNHHQQPLNVTISDL